MEQISLEQTMKQLEIASVELTKDHPANADKLWDIAQVLSMARQRLEAKGMPDKSIMNVLNWAGASLNSITSQP